ncbi:hypothetical protein [Streptomyces sp. BRA346]|uniref:hypothetical protein n=1 Tax=Streptomyces sp. BRA346 TaxID=2878199 RepID=UPI0040648FC6
MHGRSVVRTALATAAAAALVAGCRGETVTLDGQRHTRAEPRAGASTASAAPRTPTAAPRPHRTFTHTPRATPHRAAPPRTRVAAKPRGAPRVAPPVIAFGTSGERVREL